MGTPQEEHRAAQERMKAAGDALVADPTNPAKQEAAVQADAALEAAEANVPESEIPN
jgi:hypothetical protein